MTANGYTSRPRAALSAALICLAVAVAFVAITAGLADMRKDILKLVTSSGEHIIEIEVAESSADKARGLMFRRSLADNAGMLFPYTPPQEATMWMKNTYLSLDMVFIRADGTVHRVEAGTEPFSETVIASGGDVAAVLELKAGVAAKLSLRPGDKALHDLFKTKEPLAR